MLTLTRRRGEQITIGSAPNVVTLTVLDVQGPKVILGLQAPPEVRIVRSELLEHAPPAQKQ